jgi:hypothetical protein
LIALKNRNVKDSARKKKGKIMQDLKNNYVSEVTNTGGYLSGRLSKN